MRSEWKSNVSGGEPVRMAGISVLRGREGRRSKDVVPASQYDCEVVTCAREDYIHLS